jgi:hypothetical protein
MRSSNLDGGSTQLGEPIVPASRRRRGGKLGVAPALEDDCIPRRAMVVADPDIGQADRCPAFGQMDLYDVVVFGIPHLQWSLSSPSVRVGSLFCRLDAAGRAARRSPEAHSRPRSLIANIGGRSVPARPQMPDTRQGSAVQPVAAMTPDRSADRIGR